MAKKSKGKSPYGYFRELFRAKPELVDSTSNEPILQQYRIDHKMSANAPVSGKIKNTLNNCKSLARKELGKSPRAGGKRRGKRQVAVKSATNATAPRARSSAMMHLEVQIDDCLATALNADRHGLENVIDLLRSARDEVVLKKARASSR